MQLVTVKFTTCEPSERGLDGGAAGEVANVISSSCAIAGPTEVKLAFPNAPGSWPTIVREQNVSSQDAGGEPSRDGIYVTDPPGD